MLQLIHLKQAYQDHVNLRSSKNYFFPYLKKMLDKKLMVMVNSDDPAYFGGYLNQNLIETQVALNLSKNEAHKIMFYLIT